MARIPIAEVTAIGFTAPIFATLGAVLFLGERLRARRIGAVLVAFGGAMIILRPGFHEVSMGALAQLAAAPLFAISILIAKKLTETESSASIVASLTIFATIAMLPGALINWRNPSIEELGWLGLMLPETYGGSGLAWVDFVVLLEETGRTLFPSPLIANTLAAIAILENGDEEQKQRWLPQLADARTSSKNTSANSSSPVMVRIGRTVMPGVARSINRKLMPACLRGASGSVRTSTKIHCE